MLNSKYKIRNGYTLLEIIAVIIIISVLSSTALISLGGVLERARQNATMREMENIKFAIIGNTNWPSLSKKTDFGFVGKYGRVPINMQEIADFMKVDVSEVSKDAWKKDYIISDNPYAIKSISMNYTIVIASSKASLVNNNLRVIIKGANGTLPGNTEKNYISVVLKKQDGSQSSLTPDQYGMCNFTQLPIGYHLVEVTYNNGSYSEKVSQKVIVSNEFEGFVEILLNKTF